MGKIYLLLQHKLYYIDYIDDERVEDDEILGCFTEDKLEEAKRYYIDGGYKANELVFQTYDFTIRKNRKYVYILRYDYIKILPNGEWGAGYFYRFAPMYSYRECMAYKKELLKQEKYRVMPEKLFCYSDDGFFVRKLEINVVYLPKLIKKI